MLAELARKLSPWTHTRFEKWCSLAAVGDLTEEQLARLATHVAACSKCRNHLETTMQSSLQLMPALWDKRKPNVSVMPPEGMRARFLEQLEQGHFPYDDAGELQELSLPLDALADRKRRRAHNDSGRKAPFSLVLGPLSAAAALILAAGLVLAGYYRGSRTRRERPSAGESAVVVMPAPLATPPVSDAAPDHREILLRSVLADLGRQRSAALTERRTLEERLEASDARLRSLQRDRSDALERERAANQQSREELDALRKENEALRQRVAEKETFLAFEQRRRKELENELLDAHSALQSQDDPHTAKGQISDLVTARNLHIVDVYDAKGGQRNSAFGRVFYVEGKSLLFYAYDLEDTQRAKANIVFHVWGGRAGVKEITHSLGILRNEDAGQGLWTMTFDDPAVLAQINSVFVTAESSSRRDLVPHGKRILYAYIGNPPNHP